MIIYKVKREELNLNFSFLLKKRRISMTKLKDFFRSKSGKIAICVIAAVVAIAIIGTVIALKHESKIAETKKEQASNTEKRDEKIKDAESEGKKSERALEKAKNNGNKEEVDKATEKESKVQITKKNKESTNSTRSSDNKSSKASGRRPGKPNKPNPPIKPGKKETLAQEIARLKKWVWESTPNAVFLPKQYSENDDYEADVEAYARSKGVRSYGYSEIKLSNGKYIPYFWKH